MCTAWTWIYYTTLMSGCSYVNVEIWVGNEIEVSTNISNGEDITEESCNKIMVQFYNYNYINRHVNVTSVACLLIDIMFFIATFFKKKGHMFAQSLFKNILTTLD